MRAAIAIVIIVVGCNPKGRPPEEVPPPVCTIGELRCDGQVLQLCDGDDFVDQMTCPEACAPGLGCTTCVPGTGTCEGNISHACNATGSGFVDYECDPVQGSTCDGGLCTGPCAPQELGTSYVGCEYYPVVTGNIVGTMYNFAVAISNTSSEPATITIEGGALVATEVFDVAPFSVEVHPLPWQVELKLCESVSWLNCFGMQTNGALVANGAYRLRSTVPVTVYQFSPLEYRLSPTVEASTSNDASLLLPTNTWGRNFYVATWQHTDQNPSELAVVAMHDDTTVTLVTKADTPAAGGAPAFTRDVPQSITLSRGDVLELATVSGDLTGTSVTSDHPVQVIGAHYCANVPDGIGYCDHLEETMFPVETLGLEYVVNAPAVPTLPNGKVEVVRIIATEPDTHLVFDPPQPATTIARAGDFVELANTAASFAIRADRKVLVAQYMEGQGAGGNTGDPALALAVPVDQFRTHYLFHAPVNYETNYVDITAPTGAIVLLDGSPVGFAPINTGYSLARIRYLGAGPLGDGNHTVDGDAPFGIQVYGYGQYTSYFYPGGLELRPVLN